MMTHLDLFSGVGGFAYAADQVFGNVEHIFCDNEPFAREILHKHWPEAYIYDDIRQITTDNFREKWNKGPAAEVQEGYTEESGRSERVDLLTGGFPCQPFSAAGLRRGTADERHLWPEMLRVIRLVRPAWVIAENVRGLVTWNDGLVLEQVCTDLEAAGYEVQPLIIPAVAVNAPHRRDRIWFVAHAERGADGRGAGEDGRPAEEERLPERHEVGQPSQPGEAWDEDWTEVAAGICSVYDGLSDWLDESIRRGVLDGSPSKKLTPEDLRTLRKALRSPKVRDAFGRCYKVSEPEILYQTLCQLQERSGPVDLYEGSSDATKRFLREMWSDYETRRTPRGRGHYQQLAEKHKDLVPQLPYEITLALAEAWYRVRFAQAIYDSEATEGYSKSQHRASQLKAYGNAIVPQVAMVIMRGMAI